MSDLYPVKPHVAARSHLSSRAEYERLYRLSLDNPEWFWSEQAKAISWFHPWQTVFDADYDEVDFAWFSAGRLNASFNCVDRHLETLGDRTAIIWAQDEPGAYRHISYRELKHNVCRVANVLLSHGIRRGDRVCIYMSMMPELVYTMLACARIGAVHSVVFGGFSSEALRDRIVDARCRMVVTANEGLRGGKHIPLKKTVDRAVEGMSMVETVLVARRTDHEVPMTPGRDLWLDEECRKQRSTCTNEWMGAEDPLFILYTSGSTGKPKGLMHTTGGYLVYAAYTHKMVFDYHPGDVFFCAADVGWITGHSYIVYGPLANGATTVMFESTPTYPDPGRYWRIVDDLGVNIFYTAPTALRALAHGGEEWVKRYRRDSLRVLGSVGEPINPDTWRWYHDVVGDSRCAVVDTWWQTETGGILITPLPGVTPDEARLGDAALLRGQAGRARPRRRQGPRGQRRERGPLPRDAVARAGANRVGRPPPLQGDLLHPVPGLLLHRGRRAARRGRLLLDHRPHRRRPERLRAPPRHGGDRERPRRARVRGRGGGGGLPPRDQGTGHLRVRAGHVRLQLGRPRPAPGSAQGAGAPHDRRLRGAGRHPHRLGPAEDAQREDHAAHPAQDRRLRVRRAGGPQHPRRAGGRGPTDPGAQDRLK